MADPKYKGPVPKGASQSTFRKTGRTEFTYTPASGYANIRGSRGELIIRGGGATGSSSGVRDSGGIDRAEEERRKEAQRVKVVNEGIERLERRLGGRVSDRQRIAIEREVTQLKESVAKQSIARQEDLRKATKPDTFSMMSRQAKLDKQREQEDSFSQRFLRSVTPKPDTQPSKSYGQLYKEGDFPSIVRKGFYDVGGIVQKKVVSPVEAKITGKRPTPEQEKVLGKVVGETFLFGGLLGTVGRVGAVSQQQMESKYSYDVLKGRYILKKDTTRYLAERMLRDFDNAFNRGGKVEVLRKLNRVVASAKGETKGIENLLQQLKNKGYIDSFIVNTRTGQFAVGGVKPVEVSATGIRVPQMKYVGEISSVGARGNVLGLQPRNFEALSEAKTTSRQGQDSFLGLKQTLTSRQTTKQMQGSATLQLVKQIPRQDFVPRTAQGFGTPQVTVQRTNQIFRSGRSTPTKPGAKTRPPKFMIPPLGGPSSSALFGGTISSAQGFIPQVREKGRWISLIKKALSFRQARALAGNVVDNTVAAQMRLLKSKKKISKLPSIPQFSSSKFRDYMIADKKRKPLPNFGLIEKRSHRIDTLGEVQGLSVAKYLKKQGFGRKITSGRASKQRKSPFWR